MEEIDYNVLQYIEHLSESDLRKLYQSPCFCLVVIRLLPEIAKIILFKLLYHKKHINIDNWIESKSKQIELAQVKQKLYKLKMLQMNMQLVKLDPLFQNSVHLGLTGGALTQEFGVLAAIQAEVSIEFLDQYASKSWEQVLHYLVGAKSTLNNPSGDITNLLRESGLMERVGKDLQITNKGFQFLLQDMHVQVWALLLQFLDLPKSKGTIDKIEALKFLFQLASLQLGSSYRVDSLNETQLILLEKFVFLGLIYQKTNGNSFYPTRLATSLVSGNEMELYLRAQEGVGMDKEEKGFIIAETNFRVYAYTSSQLEIAILSLFVELTSRFPNMIIGIINRDSIRSALTRGISADQVFIVDKIISYLQSHAHPEMQKSIPTVPATIVDQIKLWEMEMNRFTARKGVLWLDITREQDYIDVRDYSEQFDYVLWKNDAQKRLVLTPDGHEAVKEWLMKRKTVQT